MGHLWQLVLRRRQNQIRLLEIILHTAIIQLFARSIQEIIGTLMILDCEFIYAKDLHQWFYIVNRIYSVVDVIYAKNMEFHICVF